MKYNLKFSYSGILTTFQVLNSHMWLLTIVSDSTNEEHFYQYRKLYLGNAILVRFFLAYSMWKN